MEIKLIDNNLIFETICFRGDKILEVTVPKDDNDERLCFLSLYDPQYNIIQEIAPDVKKYSFIPVYNCIYSSTDIYFANCKVNESGNIDINIGRYVQGSESIEPVISFSTDKDVFSGNKLIKIFVISNAHLIVQSEEKISYKQQSMMGHIEFKQILYNTETGESLPVRDINLINNGINKIIPVSNTHMMLKTGFSSIEDARINGDKEAEALIEGVYFASTAMFISSITRENVTNAYQMLGTAYFEKCIGSVKVFDKYITFSIYDKVKKSAEVIFFDHENNETLKAINNESSIDDLDNAYVIDGVPYVRNTYPKRTEFFNLYTAENDCIFYDEKFVAVLGKLFVFRVRKNGRNYIRIYKNPKLNLICEKEGVYNGGCFNEEQYYIYLKS